MSNQENRLRVLSRLHNLIMVMMGYINGKVETVEENDLTMTFTEEIANVMDILSKELFKDDDITTEEIIDVLDDKWMEVSGAVNEECTVPDKIKMKEIDAEIKKMMEFPNSEGGIS